MKTKRPKKDIISECTESMREYALYATQSRAIPDCRDGLKPVQRRILYTAFEMGLKPESSFRKSAALVGLTMARYHPHGDKSIYDAIVTMVQPFRIR